MSDQKPVKEEDDRQAFLKHFRKPKCFVSSGSSGVAAAAAAAVLMVALTLL